MSTTVSTLRYQKGAYIVVEGEKSSTNFFIIQEGQILLTRSINIKEIARETLNPGDFFEVESGLTGHKRISTAIAKTDTVVISVKREMFDTLIQKRPSLVEKFIRAFSNKMRLLDQILAKISLQTMDHTLSLSKVMGIGAYYEAKDRPQHASFIYHLLAQQSSDPLIAQKAKESYDKVSLLLSPEERKSINETTSGILKVPANTMIVAEGLMGNTMFFIQEGSVKICKIANNAELILATLNKGNMFGEMALIESKPRSASAITLTPSELLVINQQTFPLLIQRNPKIITRITTTLADRIWFVYRQITNASLRTDEARIYDGLLMYMEKKYMTAENMKGKFNLGLTLNEFITGIGLTLKRASAIVKDLQDKQLLTEQEGKLIVINPKFIFNRAQTFRSSASKKKE